MTNHTATDTATNTTATATETGGGAAPPVGGGGRNPFSDIARDAIDGGVNGLEIAARFAGDIVRSVVPESVVDNIPFLIAETAGVVI